VGEFKLYEEKHAVMPQFQFVVAKEWRTQDPAKEGKPDHNIDLTETNDIPMRRRSSFSTRLRVWHALTTQLFRQAAKFSPAGLTPPPCSDLSASLVRLAISRKVVP
jgi:hypothetical protein